MAKRENESHPATISIHGGHEDRVPGVPVVPPIIQSATFHWTTPADGELLYTRHGNNPNQLLVGAKVAALEGTEAGVALGSGMAATAMTLPDLSKFQASQLTTIMANVAGFPYPKYLSTLPILAPDTWRLILV